MAFDKKPSTWLGDGYDLDGTNHLVKLNTNDASTNKLLTQLTDALADPTTGDIRDVMMAVCETFYQAWIAQASADRPTRMSVSRGTSSQPGSDSTIGLVYTLRFTINPTVFGVISE